MKSISILALAFTMLLLTSCNFRTEYGNNSIPKFTRTVVKVPEIPIPPVQSLYTTILDEKFPVICGHRELFGTAKSRLEKLGWKEYNPIQVDMKIGQVGFSMKKVLDVNRGIEALAQVTYIETTVMQTTLRRDSALLVLKLNNAPAILSYTDNTITLTRDTLVSICPQREIAQGFGFASTDDLTSDEKLIVNKFGSNSFRALQLIDGKNTLEQIASKSGMSIVEIRDIMQFMKEKGFIEIM